MTPYTKYQDFRLYGFRQEDFENFPYISLCKNLDLPGQGPVYPSTIISTIFIEDHYMIIYTKYQDSIPFGLGLGGFLKFSLYKSM